MRGAAPSLALLVLALPLAAAAPMMAGSWGAGVGLFVHASASGTFACPLAAVAFQHHAPAGVLLFRAGGAAPAFGQTPEEAAEHGYVCPLGATTAFGRLTFRGSPEEGYEAHRVTDHSELAGVTTEHLTISPFGQGTPVRVRFWAQTVGGPAPSTWWAEADMVAADSA